MGGTRGRLYIKHPHLFKVSERSPPCPGGGDWLGAAWAGHGNVMMSSIHSGSGVVAGGGCFCLCFLLLGVLFEHRADHWKVIRGVLWGPLASSSRLFGACCWIVARPAPECHPSNCFNMAGVLASFVGRRGPALGDPSLPSRNGCPAVLLEAKGRDMGSNCYSSPSPPPQYAADPQDKHWLAEQQHMRATGGKMVSRARQWGWGRLGCQGGEWPGGALRPVLEEDQVGGWVGIALWRAVVGSAPLSGQSSIEGSAAGGLTVCLPLPPGLPPPRGGHSGPGC